MFIKSRFVGSVKIRIFAIFIIFSLLGCFVDNQEPTKILVFSKTNGFRHFEAIDAGIDMFFILGKEMDIAVDTTENSSVFNDESLRKYSAVVFLNVSGNVFNNHQKESFQRFIQSGGGFLAIHGPTDAERDWDWYGRLIGAYFESHPKVQSADYIVADTTHFLTKGFPRIWTRTDEFYNFENFNKDVTILVEIDESTYEGGNMDGRHPMVWYHNFDGGRSYYCQMGHTPETYSEPLFLDLMTSALRYVTGMDQNITLDYDFSKPPSDRFETEVLVNNLEEPMQFDFSNDNVIYIAERRGRVKRFDLNSGSLKVICEIPVFTKFEDGLLGLVLDPDFDENNWFYLYYTNFNGSEFRISRFTVGESPEAILESEKILLKIPKEVLDGSHTGGGMVFDENTGDLYIAVGDNTSPRAYKYAPIDEREGRMIFNAARSAGNTNDLRGKILRIHPEDDGSYSIPEGNLFVESEAKTKPEIFTMGNRQPWRLSIDSKTGWLYWGEVGPDANNDSIGHGPMGYDEFNLAKSPGNYGWPFVNGPNRAFFKYDFTADTSKGLYDTLGPINDSRYNSGLKKLPETRRPLLSYPYKKDHRFPTLGSGGRSAVGGPIYRKADYESDSSFPSYYDGKWFITDWIRGWIMVLTLDESGSIKWIDPFLPEEEFYGPMDLKFGPDGSLYVLSYGKGWFMSNREAGIIRIKYNAGNRDPVVNIQSDKVSGRVPLTVNLTSNGTYDLDGDKLEYMWYLYDNNKKLIENSSNEKFSIDLKDEGIYLMELVVWDRKGGEGRDSLILTAGNEPPVITTEITSGNKTFYFENIPFEYNVDVVDFEDGSVSDGGIKEFEVDVAITFENESNNYMEFKIENNELFTIGVPMKLNGSDCYSCHQVNDESIGPSFHAISEKYDLNDATVSMLAEKIINGGSGNWGTFSMSAHPDLSIQDAKLMAEYILNLGQEQNESNRDDNIRVSLKGSYIPQGQSEIVENLNNDKELIIFSSYKDRGKGRLPPNHVNNRYVLINPEVRLENIDFSCSLNRFILKDRVNYNLYGRFSHFGFKEIDLNGITKIVLRGNSLIEGNSIEIRKNKIDGILIGSLYIEDKNLKERLHEIEVEENFLSLEDHQKFIDSLYIILKNSKVGEYERLFNLKGIKFEL